MLAYFPMASTTVSVELVELRKQSNRHFLTLVQVTKNKRNRVTPLVHFTTAVQQPYNCQNTHEQPYKVMWNIFTVKNTRSFCKKNLGQTYGGGEGVGGRLELAIKGFGMGGS